METSAFLALAGAVNRLVEFLKPGLKGLPLPEGWYDLVVKLVAILAGVLLAFIANANLVTVIGGLSPEAGKVITGIFLGLGAEATDAILTFLYGWSLPHTTTIVAEGITTPEAEQEKYRQNQEAFATNRTPR